MMSIATSLQQARHEGQLRPWSRKQARFHKTQDAAEPHRRMGFVESYMHGLLKYFVTGHVHQGQMAGLFGPVLIAELISPHWEPRPVPVVNITALAAILELDGVALPPRASQTLVSRLRSVHKVYDMPLYPMLRGLCGIYFGLDDVWQAEADLPWSDAYVFVSGRTFGGNVKGLMAYLGAARLNAASFDDVEPALLNFIGLYDGLRDAGFVYFEHLVLVCIIAGSCIGGVPREGTLDWVGRYICWAVGLDEDKPALPTADGLS